jgi:hypothetical protein
MLETLLYDSLVALVVSLAVGFLLQFETRLRVRRAEAAIDEFDDVISRYNKRRAADASVAARESKRATMTDFDAAVLAQHGLKVPATGDDAWYDRLLPDHIKAKRDGTPR